VISKSESPRDSSGRSGVRRVLLYDEGFNDHVSVTPSTTQEELEAKLLHVASTAGWRCASGDRCSPPRVAQRLRTTILTPCVASEARSGASSSRVQTRRRSFTTR